MAKNFEHVSHIKSKLPKENINPEEFYGLTPTVDNSDAEGSSPIKVKFPKLPTKDNLIEGEIAVNYLKGHETLSIKNSEDEIVGFVNENEFFQAQEIISSALGQEKNDRIESISKLEEKIDKLNDISEENAKNIEDNELVISAALNDLNDRINDIDGGGNARYEELSNKIDNLSESVDNRFDTFDENIEKLELVISSSLNDLNTRIRELDEDSDAAFEDINSKIDAINQRIDDEAEEFNKGIDDLELVVSSSLNDLNSRIDELSNNSETQAEETNAKFDEVNQRIDDNELVISAALNDLNTRIIKHNDETYTKQEVNDLTSNFFDNVSYNSDSKEIIFRNGLDVIATIDATNFIKDGMVSNVEISEGNLVITFNTDAGKLPISIPLTSIFDPANYYDKTSADSTFATQTVVNEEIAARTAADEAINSTLETKADKVDTYTKSEVDNQFDEIEHTVSASLNDLNTRIEELSTNTTNQFTAINERMTDFDEGIDDLELVVSSSLNDLNDRIEDLKNTQIANVEANIQTLRNDMEDDELVISSSLNDLNTRMISLSNNIDSVENDVTTIKHDSYFDEELGIPLWWNGSKYVDNNGFTPGLKKGPSASRPTNLISDDNGYVYYDTDMNVNIIWDGEKWTQGGIPKLLSETGEATTLGALPSVEFEPYITSESGYATLFCNLRSSQVPFEIGYCYTNNAEVALPTIRDNKTNFGQPYTVQYDYGYVVYRGQNTLVASATNPIFIRCYFHYTAPISEKYVLYSDVYKFDGSTFEKYTRP